jgi:hypothetical protein
VNRPSPRAGEPGWRPDAGSPRRALTRSPGASPRWRDRPVSVVTACGDWVFDLSLSPPRGLRGGPALSSEPLRLRPATPQPAHLRTEHPLASLPEFKASLAPARQSGFATAPPTTCSQGTRSPKPRQLFRQGFGYLNPEPRPNGPPCNELARNPPRNPHGFQQVIHTDNTTSYRRARRGHRARTADVRNGPGSGVVVNNQNSC